jgi:hypothetical protein
MVSEHRNAKLLILGGAVEYQKASDKLESIGTILEQVCVCSFWKFKYVVGDLADKCSFCRKRNIYELLLERLSLGDLMC